LRISASLMPRTDDIALLEFISEIGNSSANSGFQLFFPGVLHCSLRSTSSSKSPFPVFSGSLATAQATPAIVTVLVSQSPSVPRHSVPRSSSQGHARRQRRRRLTHSPIWPRWRRTGGCPASSTRPRRSGVCAPSPEDGSTLWDGGSGTAPLQLGGGRSASPARCCVAHPGRRRPHALPLPPPPQRSSTRPPTSWHATGGSSRPASAPGPGRRGGGGGGRRVGRDASRGGDRLPGAPPPPIPSQHGPRGGGPSSPRSAAPPCPPPPGGRGPCRQQHEQENPKFKFLDPQNPYHAYYELRILEAKVPPPPLSHTPHPPPSPRRWAAPGPSPR